MKKLIVSSIICISEIVGYCGIPTLGGPTLSPVGGGGSIVTGYQYLSLSPTSTVPPIQVPIYGSTTSTASINALYQSLAPYFPTATWVEPINGSDTIRAPSGINYWVTNQAQLAYPYATVTTACNVAPTNGSGGVVVVLDDAGTPFLDQQITSNNITLYVCPNVVFTNDANTSTLVALSGINNVNFNVYGQGVFYDPVGYFISIANCSNVNSTVQCQSVTYAAGFLSVGSGPSSTNLNISAYATGPFNWNTLVANSATYTYYGLKMSINSQTSISITNEFQTIDNQTAISGVAKLPQTNWIVTVNSPTNYFNTNQLSVIGIKQMPYASTIVVGPSTTFMASSATASQSTTRTNWNIVFQDVYTPMQFTNLLLTNLLYGTYFTNPPSGPY